MSISTPPQLICRRLGPLPIDDWTGVRRAFRDAAEVAFQQAWLSASQPELRAARVRTGWTDDDLWVYAELEDQEIFNTADRYNQHAYTTGDVFEMFLRPSGQDAYYELHATPSNVLLQLRIPSAAAFAALPRGGGLPADWHLPAPIMRSWVRVDQSHQRWFVLAAVPFGVVAEAEPVQPGTQWRFSFSRYDYTRGQPKPVLSSSSPHTQLNYHRQQDWGTLIFQ